MSTPPSLDEATINSLIDQAARSAARLIDTAAALTDAEVAAPSMLASWTRGQVLTHVARSADAYTWLLRSAQGHAQPGRRPVTTPPPDTAGNGTELAAEIGLSMDRLTDEAKAMPTEAWHRLVVALAGWRHPAWFTMYRCLRELETHHFDLRYCYRTADWPDSYVTWALDTTLATLKAQHFPVGAVEATDLGRRWNLTPGKPVVAAVGHVLLGWLAGRTPSPDENLPLPPLWPQPPTPGWGRVDNPLA